MEIPPTPFVAGGMVHLMSEKGGKKMGGGCKISCKGAYVPAAHLFSPLSSDGTHHSAANAVSERNLQRFITALIIALLACLCLCGCKKKPAPIVITPDIEKNHLQRNHIFGNVKELKTKTFYVQRDSISVKDTADLKKLMALCDSVCEVSDRTSSIQRYTSDGWLMEFIKLSVSDTILRRNYTYDKEAHITGWEEYDANGVQVTRGNYTYDRNGFLVGEQIFQGDSMVMSFAHTTDGIGNAIRTVQTFGGYKTTLENNYNEQGLVTEIIEYEPNGKVFKTAKIEYDNYGDEVNRCVYKSGDQMIEYTYTEYAQDGRVRKVIYEDKLHHVKEFHYFFNYDANKNWLTEVCAVDGQIVYVKQRKFEYY